MPKSHRGRDSENQAFYKELSRILPETLMRLNIFLKKLVAMKRFDVVLKGYQFILKKLQSHFPAGSADLQKCKSIILLDIAWIYYQEGTTDAPWRAMKMQPGASWLEILFQAIKSKNAAECAHFLDQPTIVESEIEKVRACIKSLQGTDRISILINLANASGEWGVLTRNMTCLMRFSQWTNARWNFSQYQGGSWRSRIRIQTSIFSTPWKKGNPTRDRRKQWFILPVHEGFSNNTAETILLNAFEQLRHNPSLLCNIISLYLSIREPRNWWCFWRIIRVPRGSRPLLASFLRLKARRRIIDWWGVCKEYFSGINRGNRGFRIGYQHAHRSGSETRLDHRHVGCVESPREKMRMIMETVLSLVPAPSAWESARTSGDITRITAILIWPCILWKSIDLQIHRKGRPPFTTTWRWTSSR